MIRIVPTPARASREARADPVAPQPTIVMREAVSLRWPSAPMPRNSTCREYLSSSSKEVISSGRTNHYDGCHAVCKTEAVAKPPAMKNSKEQVLQCKCRVEQRSTGFHRTEYRNTG